MATYTVTTAKHATLTANVVDTITIDHEVGQVEVLNRGTTDIYFTADGTTPTVGGDNCYVVLPGASLQVTASGPWDNATPVKLISTGAAAYSVAGFHR